MKRKPKVGDTLFDLNVGNAAGRGRPQVLTPVIVIKVGKKYFTCAPRDGGYRPETTYRIEDWVENTSHCKGHHLYETEQEWEDEREAAAIRCQLREIFNAFGPCRLSLEILRAMKALLPNP